MKLYQMTHVHSDGEDTYLFATNDKDIDAEHVAQEMFGFEPDTRMKYIVDEVYERVEVEEVENVHVVCGGEVIFNAGKVEVKAACQRT